MVKSSLKIVQRHNGVVPIKITEPVTEEHMAYFITDDNSTKGRDPNINIINGIYNIKGKTSVNILVSNNTNKHITFNKGEYIGCLEPTITEDTAIAQQDTHSTKSVTIQKMMSEQVRPDIFDPSHHKLKTGIKSKLDTLLKEYASQFTKDETSIGTTPLMEMTTDTGDSDPVSQKPYPIAMKNYQWVKEEIKKLLTVKVICSSRSSWSAPNIVVPKGDGGKRLVIDYCTWPMPKVKDIFSKLNGAKYFSTLDLWAGYHHIPLDESSIPKTTFNSPFGKYKYVKVPFRLPQAPAYFSGVNDWNSQGFQLCNCIPQWYNNIQQNSRRISITHQTSIWETMSCKTLHEAK